MNIKDSKLIVWILRSIGFILLVSILIPFIEIWDSGYISYLGSFGNAINGITAPFIGTLVAILTFMAFIVQYQANENQRNDIKIERFENKFYEMIRLHRENVNEIEIDGVYKGRVAFEKMYEEFRFMYKKLEFISIQQFQPSEIWLARVSYYHFFIGISRNSNTLSKSENEINSEKKFIDFLLNIQDYYELHVGGIQKKGGNILEHPFDAGLNNEDTNYYFIYKPFLGHSSKLGHYYRHLYQSLKLAATDPVLNQNNNEEEFKIRYQYMKLLRVQLSNHEQSMIYFNSFFSSGLVWWEDKQFKNPWDQPLSYFLDYAFIKNIPLNQVREDGLRPDPEIEFNIRIDQRKAKGEKTYLTIEELFEQIGG